MITHKVQEKPVFKWLQPMSFTRNEFALEWVIKASFNYNKESVAKKPHLFDTNSHFFSPQNNWQIILQMLIFL